MTTLTEADVEQAALDWLARTARTLINLQFRQASVMCDSMQLTMTLSQQEFDYILADSSKHIRMDIHWGDDSDHSPARVFRVEVSSESRYPLFIAGRYNPIAGKLSYSLILRGTGRIYGLDLGVDHRNPDGEYVGEMHKNYWVPGSQDKWAFAPDDITESWDRPVEVWHQFCDEAGISHVGRLHPPVGHERLLL